MFIAPQAAPVVRGSSVRSAEVGNAATPSFSGGWYGQVMPFEAEASYAGPFSAIIPFEAEASYTLGPTSNWIPFEAEASFMFSAGGFYGSGLPFEAEASYIGIAGIPFEAEASFTCGFFSASCPIPFDA